METQNQTANTRIKVDVSRVRKDGKPLFTEKLAKVNAVLEKTGVPEIVKKK